MLNAQLRQSRSIVDIAPAAAQYTTGTHAAKESSLIVHYAL